MNVWKNACEIDISILQCYNPPRNEQHTKIKYAMTVEWITWTKIQSA